MKTAADVLSVKDEVHATLDRYLAAVRALDLEGIVAHYGPEIVAYDAIAQLEFKGIEAYKAHWKMCLEQCENMIFEPREPTIVVSGDLAFGFYLLRCGGSGPDGKEQTSWMRATFAATKRDGRWLFIHEHYSMPFDPMTSKVIGDLMPQG